MANHVYIATSLDGYIAEKDGGLDWLMNIPNPTGSDFGFADFMSGIDALVMGRATFEKVLSFDQWPYDKPVFVLSREMTMLPSDMAGKAELLCGDIDQILATLNQRGMTRLYIDGGKTVQSFLAADLIDELIVTSIPVLLGDGIPLYGALDGQLDFELVGSEVLLGQMVKSHYRRKRAGA